MGEVKHAAGPWEIAQIDTRRLYQDEHLVEAVAAIGIGSTAHRLTLSGITTEEDFLAIVRLVASAPELLEFAESMKSVVAILGCENEIVENIRNKARALVAKATLA